MDYFLMLLFSVEDVEKIVLSVDETNPWVTLLNVGAIAIFLIGLGIIIQNYICHVREKRRKDTP